MNALKPLSRFMGLLLVVSGGLLVELGIYYAIMANGPHSETLGGGLLNIVMGCILFMAGQDQ